MLTIKKLFKSYGNGETEQLVINDMSVSFPDSGFFSILGKSGCGKTTLLNIIGGIDSFDSGEIRLCGLNYTNLSSSDWSKLHTNVISFVFQEYNLLDQFTVIENLRFAVPNVEDKLFEETLEKFELLDKKEKYPNQLSGGEKQRISIIRSLLKESKVILVDEPTGNLDDETSLLVMSFLKNLTKDKLVIMITHDRLIAETYSDEVLQMKHGNLIRINTDEVCDQSIYLDELLSLKFSSRNAWKLSLKQMRQRVWKYTQYVMMFATTLFFLLLGFALLFVNEFSVASKNLIDTNTLYYKYLPVYVDNEDESRLFEGLQSNIVKFYQPYSISLEDYGENPRENSYFTRLYGYMEYHDEVAVILGAAPESDNEIIVSDYFAKALELDFDNIFSADDVIGYTIPDTSMVVSGIYKTDYQEYISVLDMDGNFLYFNDLDSTIESILQYKVNDVYSIVYTSSTFDHSNTGYLLKGFLPDFSSEKTNASIVMTTSLNSDNFVYSSFNGEIHDSNDVYISTEVLSIMIQRDFNYNITSESEFNAYWENHEEELVNYVLNKEINLSHVLYIQDKIYPYDSLRIRGIYSSNDVETEKSIQIAVSSYNELFVSDYVYTMFNNDRNELEEDMALLYNRDYDYDGFNLSEIISFREDTRPVITNIAVGLSLILSVFMILLFTNLLSRDITSMKSEIGLLRTLGIRMKSIFKLFTIEVILLGLSSMVIATLLHPLGLNLLNYIWSSGYKDLVIVSFNLNAIILGLLSLFIIMLITIVAPFMKLSRLKLIDCIKRN